MKTFKKYVFLKEKKKALKVKKKKAVKGIYGMPLFWNSYPVGGFAEIDGNNGE